MSQADLALAASKATQDQIRALGGAVPDLTSAANAAVAENLKQTLERAKTAAVGVLSGFTAHTGNLVKEANRLQREVDANAKAQAEAKRANDYFQATGNIFPMQKLVGIPTSKEVLAQYPDIDSIPKDWTAPMTSAS